MLLFLAVVGLTILPIVGVVLTVLDMINGNKEFRKWLADWNARILQSGGLPKHARPEPLRLTPRGSFACPFVADGTVCPDGASHQMFCWVRWCRWIREKLPQAGGALRGACVRRRLKVQEFKQ
jgi:hypothetical protein